jgi:hypothetical protein
MHATRLIELGRVTSVARAALWYYSSSPQTTLRYSHRLFECDGTAHVHTIIVPVEITFDALHF